MQWRAVATLGLDRSRFGAKVNASNTALVAAVKDVPSPLTGNSVDESLSCADGWPSGVSRCTGRSDATPWLASLVCQASSAEALGTARLTGPVPAGTR
jgi:hypothetical protein